MAKAQANSLTAALVAKTSVGGVHAFISLDRHFVIYPCRRRALLNVVAIHPAGSDEDVHVREESWLDSGNLDHLLETYSSFGQELQELCGSPEPSFAQGIAPWEGCGDIFRE